MPMTDEGLPETIEQRIKRKEREAGADSLKRADEIRQRIIDARKPQPEPPPPPPPTPRVNQKILDEMAQGAKRAAYFEEEKRKYAEQSMPKPDKTEGGSTPVFRPHNYVPNMDQGKVQATTLKG